MATAQGLAVLEAHRVAQGQLGQQTAADTLKLAPLLFRGGAVDANTPRWLQLMLALIGARRQQSAALAVRYMSAYRLLELGVGADPFTFEPASAVNAAQATTSLMVLGPQAFKDGVAKQAGVDLRDLTSFRGSPALQQKVAANVARASMRHVRNGGRDTVDGLIQNDKQVVGYARTTSAHPCFFCAMLASRGPVYDKDSFEESDPRFHGPGHAKVHDGCGCDLAPLYSRENPEFLARTREFEQLWKQTGNVLAFRQAYEKTAG